MKAIVYEKYGPPEVLECREVEKPSPKDDEVLIKIHATTVTTGDWRARSLEMPAGFGFIGRLIFGISKPRKPILGTELAGEVEAVGKDVRKFKPGDQVFAFPGASLGGHAEYRCMREDGALAPKPASLSYEEAAALSFGGTTALHFFRKGKLASGEKVLVNGASGGVGTAAVQLAKHFGAKVTGVCSTTNVELVLSLGARRVVDYTKEDFTRNGEVYDVILDTVGTAPFSRSRGSLKDGGRLLQVLGGLGDLLQAPWVSLTSKQKVIAGPAPERAEDLEFLAQLAEAGEFKPVIDSRYAFEQIVEAHRRVDSGRKRGTWSLPWRIHRLWYRAWPIQRAVLVEEMKPFPGRPPMRQTSTRRISSKVALILLPATWLAVGTASAAALPKGGGEPGKAHLDCVAKLAGTDKEAMIAACLTKNDPWLLKANVGYFTPPNLALELKQNNSCLRLVGVQIDGGTLDGKSATLKVRGTDVIQRLEPTDEITEVERTPWTGTLALTQTAEGWRCTGRKGE